MIGLGGEDPCPQEHAIHLGTIGTPLENKFWNAGQCCIGADCACSRKESDRTEGGQRRYLLSLELSKYRVRVGISIY